MLLYVCKDMTDTYAPVSILKLVPRSVPFSLTDTRHGASLLEFVTENRLYSSLCSACSSLTAFFLQALDLAK